MRTVLWVFAGIAWLFTTFVVTQRLTFPSDAIIDRIKFEVGRQSGGRMALEVPVVKPWGLGVSGTDVKLLSVRGEDVSESFVFDRARVRVSPFSVFSEPHVRGDVRLGDGDLSFALDLVPVEKRWELRYISTEAEDFPIDSIPPIYGVEPEGTGGLDLDVELDAPDGLANASGTARLSARTVTLTSIGSLGELLDGFDVLPVVIDELDVRIDITEGKGRVVRGVLFSSLANVELAGDITLEPTFTRSKLKLTAAVELAESAASIGSLIAATGATPWSDGKLHFTIAGTLQRPRADVERERSITRRDAGGTDEVEPDGGTDRPAGSSETIEAAREARARRLERLRDRAATRPGPSDPAGVVGAGSHELPPVGGDELVPVEEGPAPEEPGPEEPPIEEPPIEEEIQIPEEEQ